MPRKRKSMEWLKKRSAWRIAALDQIEAWVKDNDQGPYNQGAKNVVARRFEKLELFVNFFFPDAPAVPFWHKDAAALVVLPKWRALKLARSLFGGGPGITKDLQKEDLTFNMDWFTPTAWRD